MNEIYWLQRLDNFTSCLEATMVFSIVLICVFGAVQLGPRIFYDDEDLARTAKKTRKPFIISICSFAVAAAGLVFMPTTNEAFMILGVGGAVDYIQEHETLKELPDKCVEALEAWSDSLLEGEE